MSPSDTQEIFDQNERELDESIFHRLAELNPEAAAAVLENSTASPEAKTVRGEMLASLWSESDPAAALDWFLARQDQFEPSVHKEFVDTIAYALVFHDPTHASSAIPPELLQQDHMMLGMAQGLASKDPKQAFHWLSNLDPATVSSEVLNESYLSIMLVYSNEHPKSAASIIEEVTSKELREQLVESIALPFAEAYPEEASKWIAELDSDTARQTALRAIIEGSSGSGDGIAVALDAVLLNDFPSEDIEAVFEAAAQRDPANTAKMLFELPASAQPIAADTVVSEWLASSPEEVTTWLQSLSPGPVMDVALQKTAHWYLQDDPISAINWGSTVSNNDTRIKLFKEMIHLAGDTALKQIGQQIQQLEMEPHERVEIETALNQRFSEEYADLLLPSD